MLGASYFLPAEGKMFWTILDTQHYRIQTWGQFNSRIIIKKMELELRNFELELKNLKFELKFPTKKINPQINLPFLQC